MKSHFEEMGGTYRRVGDYFIPNLALPKSTNYPIGKYVRIRQTFLKNHHYVIYTKLVMNGKLNEHLAETDKCCNERMELLCNAMAKQEGVTEELKASDQMEWVCRMNNIHNRAEEIVLNEIVYTL
ncbi:MAG: TnpV protein [Clostridia bacterium]|nr:TnpV protein [Clostridia bacterium]